MKQIKRSMLLCLLIGMISFGGTADVQAAPINAQGNMTVTYTATGGTITVDRGIVTPGAVQTGDQDSTGRYSMLLTGSAVLILLALAVREVKEREENQF